MKIEIIKSADDNSVAEFFSSRSTPETDANCWKDGMNEWVASNLARKLERERDQAREQVNHYRDKLDLLPIKWDI